MSKTEHPYAQVLRWIADGETLERIYCGAWHPVDEKVSLGLIQTEVIGPGEFRLKPRTININGHEVPEPIREAPAMGTEYWTAGFALVGDMGTLHWEGDSVDSEHLRHGLCHATREAAEAHARALLSFTTQEES